MGDPEFSIKELLYAGGNPLLFGKERPASALADLPEELKKCNIPGTCKPEDVQKQLESLLDNSDASSDAGWWRDVWVEQEGRYIDNIGAWMQKPADFVVEGRPWLTRGKDYICEKAREGVEMTLRGQAEEATEEQYKEKYPLHIAVAANDLATVKKLLEDQKLDVNAKDDKGLTALQVAMTCDTKRSGWTCWPRIESAMAQYLISKGAEVNLVAPVTGVDQIKNGTYTLLHEAAFRGLTTLVKLFIEAGADVNAVYSSPSTQQDLTPLVSAARCDFRLSTGDRPGEDSTNSTIKALLDAGANPLPFGPDKPTTATMSSQLGGDKLSKECSTKVGACNEGEVKELVDKWKSSSHSGSCPDSWSELWKAQEAAAAAKSGGRRLLKLNTDYRLQITDWPHQSGAPERSQPRLHGQQ
jgi:hypothetical protein